MRVHKRFIKGWRARCVWPPVDIPYAACRSWRPSTAPCMRWRAWTRSPCRATTRPARCSAPSRWSTAYPCATAPPGARWQPGSQMRLGVHDMQGPAAQPVSLRVAPQGHASCCARHASPRAVSDLCSGSPASPRTNPPVHCLTACAASQADALLAWPGLPAALREEVQSPYCFLCASPQRLLAPQQMRGHPKLWPLPAKLAVQLSPGLRSPASGVRARVWPGRAAGWRMQAATLDTLLLSTACSCSGRRGRGVRSAQ